MVLKSQVDGGEGNFSKKKKKFKYFQKELFQGK